MPELVERRSCTLAHPSVASSYALADDDDREVLAPLVPVRGSRRQAVLDRDRLLGDQDHVGAAGDAAHDRDPARVPAHHLDDHHRGCATRPSCAAGRSPRSRSDRGVEAERVVGRDDVVVDRLRHADDRDPVLLVEPGRDAERVLAADRDERVEALRLERRARRSRSRRRRLVRVRGARCRGSCRRAAGCRRPRAARAAGRGRRQPAPPSRTPTTSMPVRAQRALTTARMTAFRPGQSPPPVSTPMTFAAAISVQEHRLAHHVPHLRPVLRDVVELVDVDALEALRAWRRSAPRCTGRRAARPCGRCAPCEQRGRPPGLA